MSQLHRQPWFAPDETPAVRDFWRVYDDRLEDVEGPSSERVRAALRVGFEGGDWTAYEQHLAELGGDPSEAVGGDLVRALAPHLVRAYVAAPDRLCAVLLVMDTFVLRRRTVLAAARDRTARSLAITLESIGDGVIATDDRGLVERMNPVACELSKWRFDEAIGRKLADVFQVVDEQTGAIVPSAIDEVLTRGIVALLPVRSAILAKDGSTRPIADSLAPIRDEDGVIHGAVLVFRDLTREREHERMIEAKQLALTDAQRQLRSVAQSAEATREEERARLARELHDELAQQLTAIRMDIGWLVPRVRSSPPEVLERLEAMAGMVDAIFGMVRRIGTELRPAILDDLGLAEAIEWHATEFERRSGIEVDVDTPHEACSLADSQSTALFRMFQEILTNVARHSQAKRVVGRLVVEEDRVTLEVTDDGRSIRPEEIANSTSLGLLGMRERAALHGGTFRIDAARGGGTVVSVTLPRHEESPS